MPQARGKKQLCIGNNVSVYDDLFHGIGALLYSSLAIYSFQQLMSLAKEKQENHSLALVIDNS